MTMDQYKEQYKKETEQIHAPADLIAKTKAAMRQEEVRIRRELAVQVAGTESKGVKGKIKKNKKRRTITKRKRK